MSDLTNYRCALTRQVFHPSAQSRYICCALALMLLMSGAGDLFAAFPGAQSSWRPLTASGQSLPHQSEWHS